MDKDISHQSKDNKKDPGYGAAGVSAVSTEDMGTFASLRLRDFRWLLGGTVLSNAAQWLP
jgi:hypothetical protein